MEDDIESYVKLVLYANMTILKGERKLVCDNLYLRWNRHGCMFPWTSLVDFAES